MKIASIAILAVLTIPILAPTAVVQEVAISAQEAPAPAEAAKVVLVAPSQARVGELVRLDVTQSVADSFKWLLVPQTVDFEVYAEGRKAVFSARTEGIYEFIVACAKGGTVDIVRHTVRVIGPPPMPQGDSLAQWIPFWNWSEMLPKEECDALAESFATIAERKDELKEPQDWLKATVEANRQTLGDRVEAWKPMLDKIGAALQKKAESGAFVTPEDYAKAWLEVAEGLKSC